MAKKLKWRSLLSRRRPDENKYRESVWRRRQSCENKYDWKLNGVTERRLGNGCRPAGKSFSRWLCNTARKWLKLKIHLQNEEEKKRKCRRRGWWSCYEEENMQPRLYHQSYSKRRRPGRRAEILAGVKARRRWRRLNSASAMRIGGGGVYECRGCYRRCWLNHRGAARNGGWPMRRLANVKPKWRGENLICVAILTNAIVTIQISIYFDTLWWRSDLV